MTGDDIVNGLSERPAEAPKGLPRKRVVKRAAPPPEAAPAAPAASAPVSASASASEAPAPVQAPAEPEADPVESLGAFAILAAAPRGRSDAPTLVRFRDGTSRGSVFMEYSYPVLSQAWEAYRREVPHGTGHDFVLLANRAAGRGVPRMWRRVAELDLDRRGSQTPYPPSFLYPSDAIAPSWQTL